MSPLELLPRSFLHDPAAIHDCNRVGKLSRQREIVGDADVTQSVRLLQIDKQVGNLTLDRKIESLEHFIKDENFRLERECACDGEALTLPSAKLMRQTMFPLCRNANILHSSLG